MAGNILKIHGIKIARAKGRVYYYHRASGKRIAASPRSPEFLLEVAQLSVEAARAPKRKIVRHHGSGTWGALVAAYRASPEFAKLADRTKRDYENVLRYLASLDGMALIQFTRKACFAIRDKAFEQHKRRFANYVVNMLSIVFAFGRDRDFGITENPAIGMKIEASSDAAEANRPWSEDECAIVLGEAKGALKVAVALGMFAGMRGGDIVRVAWNAYDGSAIEWRQGKTGEAVWLPAHRELRAILDAAPRAATTIVTGPSGRPWTEGTLRKFFRTLIARLEQEGRVGLGLTLHGLRTTAATVLADLGADVRAIQAMLGHKTPVMSFHYSRAADKKRAGTAAIHYLETRRGTP